MIRYDELHIETCAKQGDQFIPINALQHLKVKEPRYVDGSIRVTVGGQPLITDTQWTDIIHWWAGMSKVLRDLSHGKERSIQRYFPDAPVLMLFEVEGERLTWTVRTKQTRVATLDRVPALRALMAEYRHVFERMRVLNPPCASDYDVSLADMSNFRAL